MNNVALTKTAQVRLLNDELRSTLAGGTLLLTASVNALPADARAEVLSKVQSFEGFDADNDPHDEHDFGSIEVQGATYFFKIDYYAPDMNGGSEDPGDPTKTARVLTILRADEY